MAELIISIISLVIAVVAVGVSIWANRRSSSLDARLLELEEAKKEYRYQSQASARLRAEFDEDNSGQVKISNMGKSEARNARVEIEGTVFKIFDSYDNQVNLGVLGPGASQKLRVLRSSSSGTLPPYQIAITWDHDAETEGIFRTTLR